jgi:hypothetical protein
MTTPRAPRKARRKHGTADADRFHAMMGAARTKNGRDHGKCVGRRRRQPDHSYLVPLREKRHERRYVVPDPLSRPEAVRAKRRKADRKRKITRTMWRILDVFDNGLSGDGIVYPDQIRAILEDVL